MRKINKTASCFVFFLAALVLASGPVWSQQSGIEGQAESIEVSSEEVRAYVKAKEAIDAIRQEYNNRITESADPEEQQNIIAEANEKMVEAVQKTGISVERFNEILTASASDPELAKRIAEASM